MVDKERNGVEDFSTFLSPYKNATQVKQDTSDEEVILFFSYDIVNSSSFKKAETTRWAYIITQLLKQIKSRVEKLIKNVQLWRILGDEVVFIIRIYDINEIYRNIDIIFQILINISNDMMEGSIWTSIDDGKGIVNWESVKTSLQILSLRGAAWIATVSKYSDQVENADNILTQYDITQTTNKSSRKIIDEFLGNDIDAGFRIKEFSRRKRLVISFELANLLCEKTSYASKLFIITYKKLKGIWNNRLYPIIWFYDQDVNKAINFENSFAYDDAINDPLIEEYFTRKNKKNDIVMPSYMFDKPALAFNKILNDMGLCSNIIHMKNIIEQSQDMRQDVINQDGQLLELHCVAVCFEKSKGRIIIFRRGENRHKFPSCWEFGCAKADLQKDISNTLINEYATSFKLQIHPVMNDRDDSQPLPLALYNIQKENGKHKGIIMLAEIKNDIKLKDIKSELPDKYDDVKWITESEIENFSEKAVPDFKNTLELAFSKIKEFKESNNGQRK